MPPKAQPAILRGRGRPKKAAAPAPAPVANAPAKRGRVANAMDEQEPLETPKKRGHPAKTHVKESAVVADDPKRGRRSFVAPPPPFDDAPAPKKRMGRPPKTKTEAPVDGPKKRAGRPSKAEAGAEELPAPPKRRGRPARDVATHDLGRAAGSPRVSKTRTKPAPRASKASVVAPRIDPRVRSKLRTRLPPAQKIKEPVAPTPTKRRGKPAKSATAKASAPSKKVSGRTATKAAVTKLAAPRKKRGYTALEIPDKFAAQVQQYLQDLLDADSVPAPADNDAEQVAKDETEVQAEAGAEDDLDIAAEEGIVPTSIAGSDEEEEALALAQQGDPAEALDDNSAADSESDIDAQEYGAEGEIVEAMSIDNRESFKPAMAAELELNVQEAVQSEQDLEDDLDSLEQDLYEGTENYDDQATSLGDGDATSALMNDELRPTSDYIYG
ncbi:hypothetical protein BDU57DRAFT_545495 [Ampelomyces quisqualis]|uniref:Uncharacterized protein n=1 Tax=Ampelomyces quisqualis TaxID=50730 RepID=A0A6A5QSB4_AMPQU|nr:hypothetical protein BDU57DRAFT_545495 [Ampelomyces quisqualis]